jgi:hypothetical protein
MRMRVLSGAILTMLLLGPLLLLTACGGRPSTPESLFEEVVRLNSRGESGRIWDLLTEDARQSFIQSIDGYRAYIRGNPNDTTDKFYKQFHVERREVLTMSYVDLFIRENEGRKRAFEGAQIKEKTPDPTQPDEEILTVEGAAGTFYMRVRKLPNGYGLVKIDVRPR